MSTIGRRAAALALATAFGLAVAAAADAHGPGRQGQQMGPGMGYGMMGPGMMGHGMMGHGMMGPGMMGPGMGHRGMRGWPIPAGKELTVDDVRAGLERRLEWLGNPRLKVGKVAAKDDDTILAEIMTVDDSLVQRLEVDRKTGWRRQVE